MMFLKIFLIVVVLIALVFLLLGSRLLLKKSGRFPQTRIGYNKEMKKMGILCPRTMERLTRMKLKKVTEPENVSQEKNVKTE